MTPFRVLVVDDEAPARAKAKRLLAADARFELAGEARDGIEALAQVEALRPNLLLLDVQMPGLTGFEVIEALGADACPQVVFSTAYEEFAVKAFDAHAVDYLLKPWDAERFRRALDRAFAQLQTGRAAAAPLVELLEQLRQASGPGHRRERLVVKSGEAWVPLRLERVLYLSADDKYVRVHTTEGEHQIRRSLRELAALLDPRRFVRVHRSEIVNLDAVARLEAWSHGDGILVLRGGATVVLSRTYREAFLRRWGTGAS